jgi:hypothetical protein
LKLIPFILTAANRELYFGACSRTQRARNASGKQVRFCEISAAEDTNAAFQLHDFGTVPQAVRLHNYTKRGDPHLILGCGSLLLARLARRDVPPQCLVVGVKPSSRRATG